MKNKLLLIIIATMLAACGDSEYGDIRSWMKDEEKKMPKKIPDLPQIQILKPSPFEADGLNPFKIKKAIVPDVNKLKISPDLARKKEFLEGYPIENLEMVGILQPHKKSPMYALIKTNDGLLHPVKEGNYLGQNYGKVTKIEEGGLTVLEIIQDGTGEWIERINEVYLKDAPVETKTSSSRSSRGR